MKFDFNASIIGPDNRGSSTDSCGGIWHIGRQYERLLEGNWSNDPFDPFFVDPGYTRVSVNKSPTLGTTGHPTYPPVGWTGRQNATADDSNLSVTIPTFNISNLNYTAVFVGANTYLTFGSGSTVFSGLSGSVPALNKIFVGAADNSYQRVSTISSGADYTRIRYEGSANTSGTPGSPSIVWEATFFDMSKTGGVPVVEILVGTHNRTTGQFGIASTSAYYQQLTISANTSYVFVGNATGTSWTIHQQQSMSGTGY